MSAPPFAGHCPADDPVRAALGAVNTKLDAEIRARAAALPEPPEQIGELVERLARSIALGADPAKPPPTRFSG